jgi:hypothetical protein
MHPAAPGHRLTWRAVCARRLARHGLLEPVPPARLAEQVAAMCGAHAQVGSAAELSVGLRVADVGPADVRRALWEDRTLVKTFGPRGTVHLLAAADLARWTGALAATPSPGSSHAKDIALSAEQTDAVVAAIAGALTDRELTADELTEAVVARTGSWAGELVVPAFQGFWPRWRIALHTAAHRGALCFGALRGRKVTYTSPQRWAGPFAPRRARGGAVARASLPARLRPRHPRAPGPLAQRAASVGAGRFAELAGELEPVQVDGERAWVTAGDTERRPRTRRGSASCRTSTPTRSARIRASGCSPGAPSSGRSPAVRRATSPSCSSTASSPASGTCAGPAGAPR